MRITLKSERISVIAGAKMIGSSGFRVGDSDRGTPLGEAAVTMQAHAVTCHARAGVAVMGATQSEVPRNDVVDLDQMR